MVCCSIIELVPNSPSLVHVREAGLREVNAGLGEAETNGILRKSELYGKRSRSPKHHGK